MKIRLLTIFFVVGSLWTITPRALANFTIFPAQPHSHQFNYEVNPGARETGTIIVKNLDNEPLTIRAYGVDATSSNQGTFALTNRTNTQRHIGKWVSFEQDTIEIGPYEEKNVPFTINIPKIATPGDYAGGIAVEGITHQEDNNGENTMVNVAARLSTKLFIHVPGEKKHAFIWDNFYFEPAGDENRPTFFLVFQNTGNTMILAETSLEFMGFPGLQQPNLTLPVVTLQPDNELKKVEKRWDEKVMWGLYLAKATVTFSEFDIANDSKVRSETHNRYVIINLIPAPIIALFIISIILLLVFIVLKYRAYQHFIEQCVEYRVKEGEEITDVAKNHKISWKRLAKINKLKPPYTLSKNKILLVPPLHKNNRFKKSSS